MIKRLLYCSILFSIVISQTACLKDDCEATRTFYGWEPVYVALEEFRDIAITSENAKALKQPGKIYFYKNFILINEIREGVHVIDNRDPSNPNNIAFIDIPGNVDMAVKGNVLYVDSYSDLLTIDISDVMSPKVLHRNEDVFPLQGYREDLGYLVYFMETEETMEVECTSPNFQEDFFWIDNGRNNIAFFADVSAEVSAGQSAGVGGSLARFTIVKDYLYTVNDWNLNVFALSTQNATTFVREVNVGWGIETIFPSGDNLFLGANDGMYIFDNSNPTNPSFLAKFNHANACDPVFIKGDLAYVTLRDGRECENFTNQLDVVDVSSLTNPKLLETFPMHNPHGLSVAGNQLFICENDKGLKVFDVAEWENIRNGSIDEVGGFTSYDVIALEGNNLAMVIGRDGLYQFDFSDPSDLKQLSVIPVERN